jgi:hypothetical protein
MVMNDACGSIQIKYSSKHLMYIVILLSKQIYHNSIDVSSIIHLSYSVEVSELTMGECVAMRTSANEARPELDKLTSHHNYDKWGN